MTWRGWLLWFIFVFTIIYLLLGTVKAQTASTTVRSSDPHIIWLPDKPNEIGVKK